MALIVSWQVKHVPTDLMSIAKFYLYISPLVLIANIALAAGFARAHETIHNLTAVVACQTLIYYLCLIAFSLLILGDKVSLTRAIFGIALMVAGIYVLKTS